MILIQRAKESVYAQKDYLKVANNILEVAMYNLKGNSFKLWVYFTDNAEGYTMDLYPVDFCTKAKVSDSTYRRAFEDLLEKGYLRQSDKDSNVYIFYEVSDSDKIEYPDKVNSLDTDNFKELKRKYFDE